MLVFGAAESFNWERYLQLSDRSSGQIASSGFTEPFKALVGGLFHEQIFWPNLFYFTNLYRCPFLSELFFSVRSCEVAEIGPEIWKASLKLLV